MKNDDTEIDPYYQKRAEELVDLLYDKNYINPEINRKSLSELEDYIGYVLQSQSESAAKSATLLAKIKD